MKCKKCGHNNIKWPLWKGQEEGEPFSFDKHKNWKLFLIFVLFVSVLAVFMNSIGWLFPILDYVAENWDQTFIVSLIFLAIIVGVILYIVRTPKEDKA